MQWSRAKKQFESLLAPCLQKRLRVHVTEYSKASRDPTAQVMGRGWITLDGDEVVSIQIPSPQDSPLGLLPCTMSFGQAVRAYLDLTLDQAMASEDGLVRGLVFLDRRLGKRRLRRIEAASLDGFSGLTFRLRCQVEGLTLPREAIEPVPETKAEAQKPERERNFQDR